MCTISPGHPWPGRRLFFNSLLIRNQLFFLRDFFADGAGSAAASAWAG